MSEIPEDVMFIARAVVLEADFPHRATNLAEVFARAIMAERERCAGISDALGDREDVAAIEVFDATLTPIYRRGERVAREIAEAIRRGN